MLNEQASKDLHGAVSGGLRPDAVEYMIAAIKRFRGMPKEQVGQVVLEVAKLGEQGLAVNTPDKRYSLMSLPGESITGLQLMSYLHVGTQIFMPGVDAGTGLQKEYEVAKGMVG